MKKEKPRAIIVDIDGTVAKRTNRGPYDLTKVIDDEANYPVMKLVEHLIGQYEIIFVSGRQDLCRDDTLRWLARYNMPTERLYMRKTGDTRPDYEVKKEIYDTYIKDKYYVLLVLDDRDQTVKMWRENGLTCLQVDYGNF